MSYYSKFFTVITIILVASLFTFTTTYPDAFEDNTKAKMLNHDFSLDLQGDSVYIYDGMTNEELGSIPVDSVESFIVQNDKR